MLISSDSGLSVGGRLGFVQFELPPPRPTRTMLILFFRMPVRFKTTVPLSTHLDARLC